MAGHPPTAPRGHVTTMSPRHLFASAVLLVGLSSFAHADLRAGSLLVFPEFNNEPGIHQIFTITNTSALDSVTVEVVYIDGDDCTEFNRNIELTPFDTFSFLTRNHNPDMDRGYAYAFAKESTNGEPINFDYLVGSSTSITLLPHYSTNPFVFQGAGAEGTTTELNGDEMRNLDGTEYSQVPDRLVIPRFYGQGVQFQSKLYLIGLTGGARFSTTVDFLIFNDNEEVFSSEYTFNCWAKVDLLSISNLFSLDYLQNNTNHDLDEVAGLPRVETGWMILDGAVANSASTGIQDPAILAVLREGLLTEQSADLPFCEGEQSNGSLLARSLDGTF